MAGATEEVGFLAGLEKEEGVGIWRKAHDSDMVVDGVSERAWGVGRRTLEEAWDLRRETL